MKKFQLGADEMHDLALHEAIKVLANIIITTLVLVRRSPEKQ